MKTLTISELIFELQDLINQGYSGDTPVVMSAESHTAHGITACNPLVQLAKKDIESGYGIYKMVTSRGVEAVMIY